MLCCAVMNWNDDWGGGGLVHSSVVHIQILLLCIISIISAEYITLSQAWHIVPHHYTNYLLISRDDDDD